ncbi:MAG: nadD [Planctomycetaceae bacterium]|nr:nadD [Planctomycetaceae bacterium]
MRIGIYGGTFDPVHLGHLILAETCREQCQLDRVIFIPAGVPPHKQGRELTAGPLRAEMLEFAIAGHAEFSVDRSEIKRSGPSYTVETLRELRQEHPGDELFFLMGADSLAEFSLWKEPRELAELASLIVVNRGTQPPPDLEPFVPLLGADSVARIQRITMPGIDISASDIRRRAHAGHSLRYLVPRAVERFIIEHRVYG